MRSRYYLQVPLSENADGWSDQQTMEDLHETQQYAAQRLGNERRQAQHAFEGPDRRKQFNPREERRQGRGTAKQRQDQLDRRPETD